MIHKKINNSIKKLAVFLLVSSLLLVGTACQATNNNNDNNAVTEATNVTETTDAKDAKTEAQEIQASSNLTKLNLAKSEQQSLYAVMRIKDLGDLLLAFYPEYAPKTVENFQNLIKENFYQNIIFHRIVPNFVIQGGDPLGNGTGGSSQNIPGEFVSNGHYNPLLHARGVLSMARASDPNSASSQFFIVLNSESGSHLNGNYASFGRVLQGMDVVDYIASLELENGTEKPVNPPMISEVFFVSKDDVTKYLKENNLKLDFELPN